jgi:signal transduction protein with GAF and PtsI domain
MASSTAMDDSQVDVLHDTVSRIATADGFHQALDRVLDFAVDVVKCDSCFIYVLEGDDLVLRASKNPHPEILDRLKLRMGQGITGWVAEHREPVAVFREAFRDPRFQRFNELPEDRYEAFLSVPLFSRGRLVGVMNLQHREPHVHSDREIRKQRNPISLSSWKRASWSSALKASCNASSGLPRSRRISAFSARAGKSAKQ